MTMLLDLFLKSVLVLAGGVPRKNPDAVFPPT